MKHKADLTATQRIMRDELRRTLLRNIPAVIKWIVFLLAMFFAVTWGAVTIYTRWQSTQSQVTMIEACQMETGKECVIKTIAVPLEQSLEMQAPEETIKRQ